MLMHHGHVTIPVCTISILWNFHTDPYHPSKNYELKQQGDGAGEHLKNDKLRVACHGLGNTRARRTNTAKRAPNMLMHHHQVGVHIYTVLGTRGVHVHTYIMYRTFYSSSFFGVYVHVLFGVYLLHVMYCVFVLKPLDTAN